VSIYATTDGGTIDSESGAVLSGMVYAAPCDSLGNCTDGVISPLTTLMVKLNVSSAALCLVLGLPESIDLTVFDPFDETVNRTTNETLVASDLRLINSLMTSLLAAFVAVLSSATDLENQLETHEANDEAAFAVGDMLFSLMAEQQTVDLTNSSHLAVAGESLLKSLSESNNTAANVTLSVEDFQTAVQLTLLAVENVNKVITIASASNDANAIAGALSNIAVLQSQSSAAVVALKNNESPKSAFTFTNISDVEEQSLNRAPTSISLSGPLTILEGPHPQSNYIVGTATATDDTTVTGGFIFSVAGPDAAVFAIDEVTGVLSYVPPPYPDYDTQPTYTVQVTAMDKDGKSFSQAFTIIVIDVECATHPIECTTTASTTSTTSTTSTSTISTSATTTSTTTTMTTTTTEALPDCEADLLSCAAVRSSDMSFEECTLYREASTQQERTDEHLAVFLSIVNDYRTGSVSGSTQDDNDDGAAATAATTLALGDLFNVASMTVTQCGSITLALPVLAEHVDEFYAAVVAASRVQVNGQDLQFSPVELETTTTAAVPLTFLQRHGGGAVAGIVIACVVVAVIIIVVPILVLRNKHHHQQEEGQHGGGGKAQRDAAYEGGGDDPEGGHGGAYKSADENDGGADMDDVHVVGLGSAAAQQVVAGAVQPYENDNQAAAAADDRRSEQWKVTRSVRFLNESLRTAAGQQTLRNIADTYYNGSQSKAHAYLVYKLQNEVKRKHREQRGSNESSEDSSEGAIQRKKAAEDASGVVPEPTASTSHFVAGVVGDVVQTPVTP
jgi:hypothetical protein